MPWNNVATFATLGANPSALGTGLYGEPPGTTARTFPRDRATGNGGTPPSGSAYLRLIVLPAGYTAGAMTLSTTNIAKAGGSHGWYVVTDMYMNVLTATADYTDAATTWGATGTPYKLPFTSTLECPYTGFYYAGIMVVATTQPTIANSGTLQAVASHVPPVLCGVSGSGMTTPPAVGTVLPAIASSVGSSLYITMSES